MNTILYSIAGVIFLIAISQFFSYMTLLRDKKWQARINKVRSVVLRKFPLHTTTDLERIPVEIKSSRGKGTIPEYRN